MCSFEPGAAGSRAAVACGIGSWLPPRIVTNDELAARLDTSDEWIRTRTGIRARHFVSVGMPTSLLAAEAGGRAMESAGVTEVDALVLATTTPDRPCPATAPRVAERLGLAGRPAFDVSAVCTGFLGGSEQRSSGTSTSRSDSYFSMRGQEVFPHAVRRMTQAARAALDHAGWRPDEVDRLVGHQANLRILHAIGERMGIPAERLVVHLDQVGNTAAASIPLAPAHAQSTGELFAGARVVLAAFGGGATWGATAMTWPALKTRLPPRKERHD
jgi:3-oxoacyl-[acyl-carrier-protein] synthase III